MSTIVTEITHPLDSHSHLHFFSEFLRIHDELEFTSILTSGIARGPDKMNTFVNYDKNRSVPGPVLPCEGHLFLNAKMEIFTPYICENQPWGFGAKAALSKGLFI